jgi:PAS domain S-box-containing protein
MTSLEGNANAPAAGFLAGGGELGRLIAGYDWGATSVGPIGEWPGYLRTIISTILRSPVPIVTLWNADGVMIYNDAYSVFAAARHPRLLGSAVREGWPEVVDFNDNVMKTVLAGGRLSYREQELTLFRSGQAEQVWLDLDYSAVLDDANRPAGVIAIVIEATEKVLARRRLNAERERFSQMFEQSPNFMSLKYGPQHRTEIVNPAYRKLIGERDMIGKSVREAFPEIEGQGFAELLDEAYATGKTCFAYAVPLRLRGGPDGAIEEHFVDLTYQPIRDENGQIVGIFAQGNDVTDRVVAERLARETESHLQAVMQIMPNHLWMARPDGAVEWVNERAVEFFGTRDLTTPGDEWLEKIHPDDRAAAAAAYGTALRTGSPYETEIRARRHDGAYRWFLARATPVRDTDGAIARWVGTNTDIHEQKLAEAASSRDRDRLWQLSQDLLVVCDFAGLITAVNPAVTRILGWEEDEFAGHDILGFIHPNDHARSRAQLGCLTEGQMMLGFENRFRAKDGSYRVIAWTGVPEGGRIHSIGRDMTGQRAVEEALRQSQKMEAVGQLTGGIAHDFNNLLQGITGSLDLVQKRIAQGRLGDLERFIGGAMGAAGRAAALTHRLLAFSRRQPLDPRPVNPNPLIASMEDLLRRTLGERIELDLVLCANLWPTLCDPHQLENAVLNLAINGRDAMPNGGRLIIETSNCLLDAAVAFQTQEMRPGAYVCVRVTDTGIGMSEATMAKVFEPFFTTKPLGQGTGLGLSMVYGFVRQSEGYTKLDSRLGEGTSVTLFLPRCEGDSPNETADESSASAYPGGSGEVVLVVEDEPVVRGLIVEVVGDLGYAVLEASDGASGLEIMQSRGRIDLLVTDVGLPGMNGRQMADEARLLRPGLKVIFMTGYAENAASAQGFLEPGMALITKPFSMDVLAAKIRATMEESVLS